MSVRGHREFEFALHEGSLRVLRERAAIDSLPLSRFLEPLFDAGESGRVLEQPRFGRRDRFHWVEKKLPERVAVNVESASTPKSLAKREPFLGIRLNCQGSPQNRPLGVTSKPANLRTSWS